MRVMIHRGTDPLSARVVFCLSTAELGQLQPQTPYTGTGVFRGINFEMMLIVDDDLATDMDRQSEIEQRKRN